MLGTQRPAQHHTLTSGFSSRRIFVLLKQHHPPPTSPLPNIGFFQLFTVLECNVCTQHRKRIRRPVAMRAEPSPELHVRWHLLPLALNGSDSAHLKRQPLKYLVLINALLLIFKRFTYKKNRSGFFIISFHSCKRQETKRQSSALSGV